MTEYKLKMLFYGGFYDHPLSGIAVYNDEEVYFNEHTSFESIKEKDYTAEIKTAINYLETNGEDELELKNYCIYYIDGSAKTYENV